MNDDESRKRVIVLGFRPDPKAPRYALVEAVNNTFTLLNAESESTLTFPAQCADEAAQLAWLHREIERIFFEHSGISYVAIKANEFAGPENKAKRFSSYQQAILLLFCGLRGIHVFIKTYSSLSTNSTNVKADAVARVGQTTRYWDKKIADAVIAAWWGAHVH